MFADTKWVSCRPRHSRVTPSSSRRGSQPLRAAVGDPSAEGVKAAVRLAMWCPYRELPLPATEGVRHPPTLTAPLDPHHNAGLEPRRRTSTNFATPPAFMIAASSYKPRPRRTRRVALPHR